MFLKSAEGLTKIIEIFDNYRNVSNLTISTDKTKVSAVGRNITEVEINCFKRMNLKDQAIKKS